MVVSVVYLGAGCGAVKLITRVSKWDDDLVLQLGPCIFTLQCISSQLPKLHCLAEPLFQGKMQHPEQLEDWPNREGILSSLGTPVLRSRHHASPGAAHVHPQPEHCQSSRGGERSLARGTGRCVCHVGMCQGPRAHPRCQSCSDTSSSLPPAKDPAALRLALSTPACTSSGAEAHPAHLEQQLQGQEGRGAAALTYPAVRPPYVL